MNEIKSLLTACILGLASVGSYATTTEQPVNAKKQEKANFFKNIKQTSKAGKSLRAQQEQSEELREQALSGLINAGRNKDILVEQTNNLEYYLQLDRNKALESEVSYKQAQISRLTEIINSSDCVKQANGCPTLSKEASRLEKQIEELTSKIKIVTKEQ